MKVSTQQVAPKPLAELAAEAARMLIAGEFSELAAQFGYAIALGRIPSAAVQDDLGACLAQLGEERLDRNAEPEVKIRYFRPGDQLYAVAESSLGTVGGHRLLLELVVSIVGNDFHVTLEQLSAAA